MSVVAEGPASSVGPRVSQRWQALDPLLPVPPGVPPGCGAALAVAGPGGQHAAAGVCEHWTGAAGSLDLAWGAARRYQLTAQVAGHDVAAGLDRLLSQWRDHLAEVPGTDGEDTAAVVTWPSRDIDGIGALLRHGLAPMGVLAARSARHGRPAEPGRSAAELATGETATTGHGTRIRRATLADIDAVVRLGLEVVRFDAHFGAIERPETPAALRDAAAGLLAGPAPWTWLAERDGVAIGMLAAQQPQAAAWIAPAVRLAPAAYLMLMFVQADERGSGLGAALTARLHSQVEAVGVPVTLLHYEQTNPLSAPFWAQQGYRPLWTSWEARPGRAIR